MAVANRHGTPPARRRHERSHMGAISDKMKAKVKQLEGRATGDRVREAQGTAEKAKAEVEGAMERVKNRVEAKVKQVRRKRAAKRASR
jgi:uncharacterized protein YjbJ (UPF0337 family)